MKFEVGQTYTCRSTCNYDTVFSWTVVKRSAKTITVTGEGDTNKRCGIKVNDDGREFAYPAGRYSMCPVIKA